MLISPPFLFGTDDASILDAGLKNVAARESTTQTPEGNFPVSQSLMWHTGLHLQAPVMDSQAYTPVRAIADGKVLFVNRPRPKVDDVNHPQAYNPYGDTASWIDNGMIIIEHETEIGADGDTPTKIKFYSSYLHLSRIQLGIINDKQVYRKDILGETGEIFGHAGEMEMSISCGADELKKLIGRDPLWQDPKQAPTKDGRIDSLFGNLYIYLPADTPISTTAPTSHLSATSSKTLGTAQWVEINYTDGQGTLTTYAIDGNKGNTAGVEKDFEYGLYDEANVRHKSVAGAGATDSSPSGWYELLRFGRNLGRSAADKDPLPANAAHWRQIKTVDGQDVWTDLNAPGSFKFSDADFLPMMGWNCYGDDSKPDDQRCDSAKLKDLIVDPSDPDSKNDDKKLAMRLGLPEVFPKLARTICQFPNEWDKDTIVTRYQCLKEEAEATADGTIEGWLAFEDHLKIMAFEALPAAFKAADWHFHPAEFIRILRKCGWLSAKELEQLIPKFALRTTKNGWVSEPVHPPSLSSPRWLSRITELNKSNRKFGVTTPARIASFYGNALQETQWLTLFRESNNDNGEPSARYYPWDGRGFFQLTWPNNYIRYWEFRGKSIDADLKARLSAAAKTANSTRSNVGLQDAAVKVPQEMIDWREGILKPAATSLFPNYDLTNTAGAYWAWSGAAKSADKVGSNDRKTVAGPKGASFIYYEHRPFGEVAATVNVGSPSDKFTSIYGVQARFQAFSVAQAVLFDLPQFSYGDGSFKEIPEGVDLRREQ
ncbi:MAG: M23 family metallopeptidase [Collimonas sp.]|uniref:M23 family metallopeptidase n=1 Tax=Collimonas sp. TaxID=1963772 RepID=UPI0032670AED